MAKRTVALSMIGMLTLTACAPVIRWDKAGATPQSFAQAKLNCIQTANASVPGYMAFGPPLMVAAAAAGHEEAQQNVFNTCMEAQGWTGTRIR